MAPSTLVMFLVFSFFAEVLCSRESVCYVRNWAQYKKHPAKFLPQHIDVELCSVIDFAFMRVNLKTHQLEGPGGKGEWFINQLQLLKLKRPALKIFVSVGGWSHETVPRFHNMVKSKGNQIIFIKSVIEYLARHKLDGINIDWEYPTIRGNPNAPEDKKRFPEFLKRMKDAFRETATYGGTRYHLTLVVSASRKKIPLAYDIPEIAKHVDWVNVMAYNLRSWRQRVTGCPTLTYGTPPTVVDSLDAWHEGGMPYNKINLGLASYGRTFQLADPRAHGLGARIKGHGNGGRYTNESSILSYYEICRIPWTSKTLFYESGCGTPFASVSDTWVAYEDPLSIRYKIQTLVKCRGLKGFSFWALDFDDFTGENCNQGRYPSLSAAVDEMKVDTGKDCTGGLSSILDRVSKRWPDWWGRKVVSDEGKVVPDA